MTEAEYLNEKRFPISTQKGLRIEKQMLIDAINLDDLEALVQQQRALNEEQKAILAELQFKRANFRLKPAPRRP